MNNHREYLFSFSLIALVVIGANLHNVFGLDILLQDDNWRYLKYINGEFFYYVPDRILGLISLIKWCFVFIFSNYSAELARLLMLLLFMLPLSCLFYVFNRKYMGLPIWVSLGSAIIINIIPRQFLIPAFLDGSYPVMGALAFFLAMILIAEYLRSEQPGYLQLLAIATGWLLVCDFLNEMVFFLLPATVYFIHSSDSKSWKKLRLYIVLLICTFAWLVHYFLNFGNWPNRVPVKVPVSEMAHRVVLSLEWWLPFSSQGALTLGAGVLILCLLISAAVLSFRTTSQCKNHSRAFVFYGIFATCALPFWLISPYVASRHFYLPYISLTTLILMSLYQIFILPSRHRQTVATISLAAIVLYYSVQRYALNRQRFEEFNQNNASTLSLLQNRPIGAGMQIAMVNINHSTWGYHDWSSGYLQYQLKKPGIEGIIGDELNFYDPFRQAKDCFVQSMICLDPNGRLMGFRKTDDGEFEEMKYFLRWLDPGSVDSEWEMYSTNDNYELFLVESAAGFPAYLNALSTLGISSQRVLWGNIEDTAPGNPILQ